MFFLAISVFLTPKKRSTWADKSVHYKKVPFTTYSDRERVAWLVLEIEFPYFQNMKILLSLLVMCCLFSVVSAQTTYEVTTFSGRPVTGYEDGPKDSALFSGPYGMVKDSLGNIFIGELTNSCIRKINTSNIVSTFTGKRGVKIVKDGALSDATFNQPSAMVFDKSGNMIVVDNMGDRIRKITPGGVVSTIAGNGSRTTKDGLALQAGFELPRAICVDDTGNFYIAEYHAVRKISVNGMVSTLASGFNICQGIIIDKSGNLYVADNGANLIKKISPNGTVSTFRSNIKQPVHLCFDDSGYIICSARTQVVRISPDGSAIQEIAGTKTAGTRNGVGSAAAFSDITGLIMIAPGEFIISERNGVIRKMVVKTPAPPKPDYLNLPGSMCLGSTVSFEPTTTGSIPNLTVKADSSESTAPKAYFKNQSSVFVVNANDSIIRYDHQGNIQQVYNDLPYLTGVRSIVADENNRLYVVAIDLGTTYPVVYRFNSDGSWDISWQTPAYYFTGIAGMAMGPDGYLYVSDTVNVMMAKIDTSNATPSNLPFPSSQYSFYKPTGIAFDKTGTLYVADVGHQNILRRDAGDGNYYKVFTGFDTLGWNISMIDIETSADEFTMFASSGGIAPYKAVQITGLGNPQIMDFTAFPLFDVNNPAAVFQTVEAGKAPVFWILNSGGNNIKTYEIFAYTITPQLPAGLSYNFQTGEIYGTPLAASPAKAYVISVTSNMGTSSDTIVFGVTPPGPLSSAAGVSNSPLVKHKDGLSIQYYKDNNCERMIAISDSIGGSTPGNVLVNQEVFPTVASFNTKAFVGRVTKINNSDPEAEARLKLYFTYQDIENYNANNGAAQDLSNDTTGGTMQVAVLQMHTDTNGREQAIKHNPITASWISQEKNWMVDFQIDKFSTFYMGDPVTVDEFDCTNSGSDSIVVNGNAYYWEGDSLKSSGEYYQTLVNKDGCDSMATLKLTLIPDSTGTGNVVVYSKMAVKIYPNPSSGIFEVEISNRHTSTFAIKVFDPMGKEVFHSLSEGSTQVDLRHLPQGLYFISIDGGGNKATYRVLKQ